MAADHDGHVAQGGDVGRTGGRGAEEGADLGDAAGDLDLVVEDVAPGVAAGEAFELLVDAGAGGVEQVHDAGCPTASASSWAWMIFSKVRLPQVPALTEKSLAMTQTSRPSTLPTR